MHKIFSIFIYSFILVACAHGRLRSSQSKYKNPNKSIHEMQKADG